MNMAVEVTLAVIGIEGEDTVPGLIGSNHF